MKYRAVTLLVLTSLASGATFAQQRGGYSQSAVDSVQIELMKTQADLYRAYTECVRSAPPCVAPQRVEIPPAPRELGRGGYSQAQTESARRAFTEAQAAAFRAYAQCAKTNGSAACGGAP